MIRSSLIFPNVFLLIYFCCVFSQPITNTNSTEDVEILITDDTQTSTKIVGGNSSPRKNAWPWMAVLLYSGEVNCGGILISESHILTAAHCAGGDGASPDQVRLGDYDLRYSDSGEQTFGISWIKLHENYNKEIDENDIAIIKLSRSVRFSKSIQAASLAESGESYTYGIATGWGDTRKGGRISNVLLEVRVRIWSNSECANRYRSIDNYVSENMLCAGEPGKDTCQGDSGGPLNCPVTKFRPGQPQYKICGITSWGAGCGHNGYPGVYTRISKYIDWIDQHTGDYSIGDTLFDEPEGSGDSDCDDEDDCYYSQSPRRQF